MKSIVLLFLFCLVFMHMKAQHDTHTFSILEGTWQANFDQGIFTESWEIISDTLVKGEGMFIVNGQVQMQEKMSILKDKGSWIYRVSVDSAEPVDFLLASREKQKWLFENKMHDFPQQITYSMKSEDRIHVEVKGETGNGEKVLRFDFIRIR